MNYGFFQQWLLTQWQHLRDLLDILRSQKVLEYKIVWKDSWPDRRISYFFVKLLVYEHMCMFVRDHVCTGTCVRACMWRAEISLRCQSSSVLFFEAGPLTRTWSSFTKPHCLASQPQRPACLYFPIVGITNLCHHTDFNFCNMGSGELSPCLHCVMQVFHWLSHLLASQSSFSCLLM